MTQMSVPANGHRADDHVDQRPAEDSVMADEEDTASLPNTQPVPVSIPQPPTTMSISDEYTSDDPTSSQSTCSREQSPLFVPVEEGHTPDVSAAGNTSFPNFPSVSYFAGASNIVIEGGVFINTEGDYFSMDVSPSRWSANWTAGNRSRRGPLSGSNIPHSFRFGAHQESGTLSTDSDNINSASDTHGTTGQDHRSGVDYSPIASFARDQNGNGANNVAITNASFLHVGGRVHVSRGRISPLRGSRGTGQRSRPPY